MRHFHDFNLVFAGRKEVLRRIEPVFRTLFAENDNVIEVAVVGGTNRDPEVEMLKRIGINFKLSIFNVAGNYDFYFDLNKPLIPNKKQYDLVLCSQVLEHLYDTNIAIGNLTSLTKKGGFLYVNCPFSNRKHEDHISSFYSSGYSSKYLSMNICKDYEVLVCEDIGNERVYKQIHNFQFWPNELEHKVPLLRGFRGLSPHFILYFLKYLPRNLISHFHDSKWQSNTNFSVETYALARRRN